MKEGDTVGNTEFGLYAVEYRFNGMLDKRSSERLTQ